MKDELRWDICFLGLSLSQPQLFALKKKSKIKNYDRNKMIGDSLDKKISIVQS